MFSLPQRLQLGCLAVRLSSGALALSASLAFAGQASALTVSVNCPSQSINAAIAAAFSGAGRPPSLEKLTINVSGTCSENVVIPVHREVTLQGITNAILQPGTAGLPVLKSIGRGEINNFTIRSSLTVDAPGGLVQVGDYGYLNIQNTFITSTTVDVLVQAYLTSEVKILNSLISGGVESAVQVSNNSHAFIYAFGGGRTTIRNSSAGDTFRTAIGCYQANLTVWPIGASSTVVIGPSRHGIDSNNCTARIGAVEDEDGAVYITGNTIAALSADGGDSYDVRRTTISLNPGSAVEVAAGSLEISGSRIANNGSGLHARRDAVISFTDTNGVNQVIQNERYTCYQGGHIYADPGDIVGAVSTDCLTVGGAETH
jgi:hypothetical protein